ncbi:MAG: hypothetical protein NT080_02950 [Spirochaetes bacterium]|nr:hypothetical protein [Spirochaetota bacterium]
MKKTMFAAALVLLALATAPAFDVESASLHLYLAGLSRAETPSVREGFAVFSASGPYRCVGAAFEHEGWAAVHSFERNGLGVFVLAYPVPCDRDAPLSYRLVIDGVWTKDPSNAAAVRDGRTGLEISVLPIPFLSSERPGVWRQLSADGRTVRFLFKGEPGQVVTVSGDFNGWDPFLHELAETAPGVYRLELELPPGRHLYSFFYRGDRLPDPLNPSLIYTGEGTPVSVIVVPGT